MNTVACAFGVFGPTNSGLRALPPEQLARVRRAVRSGQAESVSGYITRVLEEHEQRESLQKLVEDLVP